MALVALTVILTAMITSCSGGTSLTPSPPPTTGVSPTAPSSPPISPTPHTIYLPGIGADEDSPPATSTPSPTTTPAGPTPLPPPVPKPGYGVQVHLLAGDPEETLRWAEGLGVGWVKQQVEWHTIEHGPEDMDWTLLDRAVDACDRFGFKLLLSIAHAPDWTRSTTLESGPPTDYAEFGRFMEQLSARYQGRVAAYELWNEPNLAREWRGDTLDPARFVALLAEGAQGVRAGDPDAMIISGAPGVTGINDGETAIDDRVFLRGMYEASVAQWVDGIGAHPYGYANPPQESVEDAEHTTSSHNDHPSFFFRDTLEDYYKIMLAYGDAEHQIWVTEFGWPSPKNMGDMDTTGWEYAREISEAEQADYIVRALHMGDERPWVGPMFLWNLNLATIWGTGNSFSAYSLLRPDGSYRPAYIKLRLAEPTE